MPQTHIRKSELTDILLEIKNLHTYFELEEGTLKAINGVSFTIKKRGTLGIVGESGCGKSVTAQSILRIVPSPGKIAAGEILLYRDDGSTVDIAALDEESEQMRAIRGREVAMVFQEPMTAFSPVHTIGNQLMEAMLVHGERDKKKVRQRAIDLLAEVGIPAPERRIDDYPFQLSGGMRQRSMIAMAMMLNPRLLIADEPTTALDVTIQAQILRLMKRLQNEFGMAIMFITHDLGVIANMADDVAVMYMGKIVEYGTVRQIFKNPLHPYTKGLMRSIPKFGETEGGRLATIKGSVPIPINPPDACPFASRCDQFIAGRCDQRMPPATEVETGHIVNCVLYEE
jgi:peptide/nickel transport system ATP-binding protein